MGMIFIKWKISAIKKVTSLVIALFSYSNVPHQSIVILWSHKLLEFWSILYFRIYPHWPVKVKKLQWRRSSGLKWTKSMVTHSEVPMIYQLDPINILFGITVKIKAAIFVMFCFYSWSSRLASAGGGSKWSSPEKSAFRSFQY